MHRFFLPEFSLTNRFITIQDKNEIHHIKNVLRLKTKDLVQVFNATGLEITGRIKTITNKRVDIDVTSQIQRLAPKNQIILACAIPKKAKFETIIEKCTELGITEIIPMITSRTEFSMSEERGQKKQARYQTVAINAAKQSQRPTIPKIHPIMTFKDALAYITPNDLVFIPCLTEPRKHLKEFLTQKKINDRRIIYFIGPEGDFTIEEINQAKDKGAIPISLGNTTLKVDTAAISVMAFINLALSDED